MTDKQLRDYLLDLVRRRLRTATLGAEIPPDTPITDPLRQSFVFALLTYYSGGMLKAEELAAGLLAVRTADDEALEALLAKLPQMDDQRCELLAQAWTERRQQYESERDKWSSAHLN